jgi:methionine-rich copper-binding protein CopC
MYKIFTNFIFFIVKKSTPIKILIFLVFFINIWLTSYAHASTETISLPASYNGSDISFTNIYSTATPISSDSANSGTDVYRVTFKVSSGTGKIKLTTVEGLTAETGYPSLGTDEETTQISFTATSLATANAAAASLQYKGGEGTLTAAVLNITTAGGNAAYNSNTGSYYLYVDNPVTWAAARTAAAASNLNGIKGYLATVTTADEFTFIRDTSTATDFWLGGTDSVTEGTWKWVNDEGVPADERDKTFWIGTSDDGSAQNGYTTFWNDGEPNDFENGEDALVADAAGSTWADLPTTGFTRPYVIEYTPSASSGSLSSLNISVAGGPTISSLSPVDNATGVLLDANLVITFSESVAADTGNITIYKASDDTVFEAIDVTDAAVSGSGTATITINPSSSFAAGESYYVLIDATAFNTSTGGFLSFAGISSTTAFNFSVITEPTLSASSPSDNATGVSITANIVLTFSEDVTAVSGDIFIKKTSDNSTIETIAVNDATKVSGSGTTIITVNPATTLAVSTEYYVLIDATAFDSVNNIDYAGISSTTALSFTTGAVSTPPTMTITAAEGVDGFESDDATLSLTFTSNEATTNFAEADITVSNATLSNFTAVSATVYTATLTPTAAGAVTIDVAAGTFTNANANNNLAATQFNWTYGSDPTKKADVMGTIQATSNAAIGFTSTSIKSVQNRLGWLRRNKDKEKTSHQGIKISFSNPILNYVINNNSLDFKTLTHQAVAHTNTSVQMNNPAIQTALSQMNKSASEMMKQVEDKYQVVSLNPNQSAGPLFNDWSIWTEGKIMAGSLDGNNGSANQKSDTLNVAIGIDKPTANAGLVGVALNLGTDDIKVGSAGSGIESKNVSLSLYNIIQTKNLLDVETQLGLGRMSIDTVRKDGSQTLNGDRDVMMPFASVAIRNKPFQYQAASLTPYGRAEWAYIELDSYTENGGNLALQYDKQKINRYMLFVGSDVNYETSFASGRLKPFAAFEYGLDLTSNSDVSMNYAGVNTKYQTQLEKVATSNVMLRLGLDYKREDETNFSISYERQEAIGAGNSDSIQFKFSKVLGKVN